MKRLSYEITLIENIKYNKNCKLQRYRIMKYLAALYLFTMNLGELN